jgi:hypothetical protein
MRLRKTLKRTFNPIRRTRTFIRQRWLEIAGPRMVSAHNLSDEAFLRLFNLPEVESLLRNGDVAGAKVFLCNHYKHRVLSDWVVPPRTLTDLPISLDDLGQGELVARADAILEHDFFPGAPRPMINPEGNIDWCSRSSASKEWLWRLNRHQWWTVLGLAYAETGDERYALAFVSQMVDWIRNNPPPPLKDETSSTWRLMEVGLRVRTSWIPAYALFYRSPNFSNEAKLTMLRSIFDHARFLSLFHTNRNHLLRESNGLAYVGFCFHEFKEAEAFQEIALTRLERELTRQVNVDGSHIELSTGYQWLVVDEYEATYHLLQVYNGSLPKEDLSSWLIRMYSFLAHIARPDGTFPQINDGFLFWDNSRLAKAGKMLDCEDLVFIGTSDEEGSTPVDTSIGFEDAGLYIMRSDWTNEARYLVFDAGPYGGPHGHEDKLSIEVFAFGQPFIVDSGSYTYNKSDPFRVYFVGSQGHNTILVDGQSQIRRWQKENLNPKPARGNYATWISQSDFDYVAATYSDGYSHFSLQRPQEPKIIQDVIHTRRILFVKPDYWVIADELLASKTHNYQVLFHTYPGILVASGINEGVFLQSHSSSAGLYLIQANHADIQISWPAGSEAPIQGWYSPHHREKIASNVVIFEKRNCSSTLITTLIYPCQEGANGCRASIRPLNIDDQEGSAFVVDHDYGRDYLSFLQDENIMKFGPYELRGIVAGVRTDNNGNFLSKFEGRLS